MAEGKARRGTKRDLQRSALLQKIPTFALRRLLQESNLQHIKSFQAITRSELLEEIQKQSDITDDEINKLFEDYRYGHRISLRLYTFDSSLLLQLAGPDLLEALSSVLNEYSQDDVSSQPESSDSVVNEDDYEEPKESFSRLTFLDYDEFGDTIEIGYKYIVDRTYLDENENMAVIHETRYGFVWIAYNSGFLAIPTKDDQVSNKVVNSLITCLQFVPTRLKFPKEIVDTHFPLEMARRITHFDTETGVRHTISGSREALQSRDYHAEILSRDESNLRPGTLYDEELEPGYTTGIGVTSSQGKIYLTKFVRATLLRQWAVTQLLEFFSDLRKELDTEPSLVYHPIPAINRLRGITPRGKLYLESLVNALIKLKHQGISNINFSTEVVAITTELGKHAKPTLFIECDMCGESGDRCPNCGRVSALRLDHGEIICNGCDQQLSHDKIVSVCCVNGHLLHKSMSTSLALRFSNDIARVIGRTLGEAGVQWDDVSDIFFVQDDTLYHLRQFSGARSIVIYEGDHVVAKVSNSQNVAVGKHIYQENHQNGE